MKREMYSYTHNKSLFSFNMLYIRRCVFVLKQLKNGENAVDGHSYYDSIREFVLDCIFFGNLIEIFPKVNPQNCVKNYTEYSEANNEQ